MRGSRYSGNKWSTLFLGSWLALAPAQAEQRVALVIGNGTYQDAPLRNPPNDARAVSQELQQCGFQVIERIDCDQQGMEDAFRRFGEQIPRGGVGVFYYAGHGMQVEGRNYLIPVKADIKAEDEVKYKAVDAGMVLGKMEAAGARVNIVILDACRNSPFARSFRSSSRGLVKMDAPKGTLLAYATAPGEVAADGTGSNGLYTSMLLKHLGEPGLPVEMVFKKVREEVIKVAGDSQIPWESSSLVGDFCFVPGVPSPPALLTPLAVPGQHGHLQVNVNTPGSKVYVDGTYRGEARPDQPLNLPNLGTGTVEVRVEAAGYKTHTGRYALKGNGWTQVVIALEAVPPLPPTAHPEPVPSRPLVASKVEKGEMVLVPAGEFVMGSGDGEVDEKPVHKVYLDAFYIDKYEVTAEQYWQFCKATGRGIPQVPGWRQFSNCPVIVSWDGAVAFCRWAGKRLPTEAEWEKAARGTDGRTYPWGEGIDASKANYSGNDTTPGGRYPAGVSPYGAYDMAGNVSEWVVDRYDSGYYARSPSRNPKGASIWRGSSARVLRGGWIHSGPDGLRASGRAWGLPSMGDLGGFRCARD